MAEERVDPSDPKRYPPNIQAILKAPSPASALLGMQLVSIDQERLAARLAFHASDRLANKWGGLQGGMVAAMLDDAMSVAVGLSLAWGEITPTLEMKTSFLKAAYPGHFVADGYVVRRGGSVAFVEAQLWDVEGEMVATGSSTTRIAKIRRD